MKRRDFIKYTTMGGVGLWLGAKLPWLGHRPAHAATVASLDITITDTIKEMATFNALSAVMDPNPASVGENGTCYFWIYKVKATLADETEIDLPPDYPGPTLFAVEGDTINLTITNKLDENHSLVIPGMFDSDPIAPDGVLNTSFTVGAPGTHLYHDNLNSPVNRVMGLHGALVVMPKFKSGAKWTPYSAAQVTPQVQLLFDELGSADHWPGLAWEEGNAPTLTPPFRQYVWLCSQASPTLFRDVGSENPGKDFNAAKFQERFMNDAFSVNNFYLSTASDIPCYWMINGLSGHFCHNNATIVPMARFGEPVVVRVLNGGLATHSMHLHANHFYLLSVAGVVQGSPLGAGTNNPSLLRPGPIWIDTMTLHGFGLPSDRYDMLIPYMRCPDIPNVRGIGRGGCPDAALALPGGGTTYPMWEEFDRYHPGIDRTAKSSIDGTTEVPIGVRQSPLCYPMHDHSEASQNAQGGNYNCGLIAGLYVIGDLNTDLPPQKVRMVMPGGGTEDGPDLPPHTFPMDHDFAHMLFAPHPDALATPGAARQVYGISSAMQNGLMPAGRDLEMHSQHDRPDFPAPFVEPDPQP
jgi:FtsP/CotA-like multicopper oxidase with cupredoxin domain